MRERQLAAEGVDSIGALLFHVPFRYEDRREVTEVAGVECEGPHTLCGHLRDVRLVLRRGRRFSLVRGVLEDESGSISVSWFNRPYLPNQVKSEEQYLLHGMIRSRAGGLELQNPSCEPTSTALHTGRIVPVYAALGPLGPALVRRIVSQVIRSFELSTEVEDPLPTELLDRRQMLPLGPALDAVHAPDDDASVEELNSFSTTAHRRLIYGELFDFQLRLAEARLTDGGAAEGRGLTWTSATRELISEILPFEPTAAQQRAIQEIVEDLQKERPMRRLLQGDVGSGKTAVALAAIVATMENGLQTAFMAPTELLAEQHYGALRGLLGDRFRIALLTGSNSPASATMNSLAQGEVDLVVGTHALIQEGVEFHDLGLAVIDEQHKFGVAQRARLGEKGPRTDLLVMTATPIPRTLTLTAYGDLDLSVLDELPPGRRPIETTVLRQSERESAYDALRREMERGGRGFVVYPKIEYRPESDVVSLEGGTTEIETLLPGGSVGIVHGGIAAEERAGIMQQFSEGDLQVLLATTVIEVGVDIPEATVIIIESAERFGLAQLHQLRGRVGRSDRTARCYAIHGRLTEQADRRLEVFGRSNDGFELAETDLLIRGPGEVLGKRQAGMPRFRVADLLRDTELLTLARRDARRLVTEWNGRRLRRLMTSLGHGPRPMNERLARA